MLKPITTRIKYEERIHDIKAHWTQSTFLCSSMDVYKKGRTLFVSCVYNLAAFSYPVAKSVFYVSRHSWKNVLIGVLWGGGWDTVKLLNKIKLLKYMVLLRCWNILWGFKTGVRVYGGLLICLWNISPPSPFIFHGRKILIHVSWKVIWKPQSSLNPYRLMLEVRYRTGWSLCRSAGRLLHNWLVLMQQYRQTPELLSGRLSSNNEATLSMDICKYNFQVRIAENSYHIISFTKITF